MNWILDRLREPSTYAGLSGLSVVIGLNASEWQAVTTALAAIAGLIAVFISEKKSVA